MGALIPEASDGQAGGQEFDRSWLERAVKMLWSWAVYGAVFDYALVKPLKLPNF